MHKLYFSLTVIPKVSAFFLLTCSCLTRSGVMTLRQGLVAVPAVLEIKSDDNWQLTIIYISIYFTVLRKNAK